MINVKLLLNKLQRYDRVNPELPIFLARAEWDAPLREFIGIKVFNDKVIFCAGDIVAVPMEKADDEPPDL